MFRDDSDRRKMAKEEEERVPRYREMKSSFVRYGKEKAYLPNSTGVSERETLRLRGGAMLQVVQCC